MRQIVDTTDLQASFKQCLALFAWTAWSGPCHTSRELWENATRQFAASHPEMFIDFAYVDLTEQIGELWDTLTELLGDQESIDSGTFMYAGAGSVAWIHDGYVLGWTLNAGTNDEDNLVKRTVDLLGSARSNDGEPCRAPKDGLRGF